MAGKYQNSAANVAEAHLQYAYVVLAGDKESLRASRWNSLDQRDRRMLAWMANLSASKGDAALQSLTALERGKLHCEARRLISVLQVVLRCAQGGEVVSQFTAVSHEADGMAA